MLAMIQQMAGDESPYYSPTSWDCNTPCGLQAPDMLYLWLKEKISGEISLLKSTSHVEQSSILHTIDYSTQEAIGWQIIEVDEGGVKAHDTHKRINQGVSHADWAGKVAEALGVGGQIIRIGVAAYGIHPQAAVEDLCFVCKDRKNKDTGTIERFYEVCDVDKLETKLARAIEALDDYREGCLLQGDEIVTNISQITV